MRANESAQLLGDGEGDQIIGQGQQATALTLQPRGGVGMAALRTGPMVAGVIDKVELAAVAAEELAAQRGRATRDNGGDGAPMRGQHTRTELPLVRRPVAAHDPGPG